MGTPVEVYPVAPAGEQKAPGVTYAAAAVVAVVVATGAAVVATVARVVRTVAAVVATAAVVAGRVLPDVPAGTTVAVVLVAVVFVLALLEHPTRKNAATAATTMTTANFVRSAIRITNTSLGCRDGCTAEVRVEVAPGASLGRGGNPSGRSVTRRLKCSTRYS